MKAFNRYFSFILYMVALFLITVLDVIAGIQINLWILYGVPVGLATWNLGRIPGLWLAAISTGLLLATASVWGHPYAGFGYMVFASSSKAIAFLVLVWLVGAFRRREIERIYTPPSSGK